MGLFLGLCRHISDFTSSLAVLYIHVASRDGTGKSVCGCNITWENSDQEILRLMGLLRGVEVMTVLGFGCCVLQHAKWGTRAGVLRFGQIHTGKGNDIELIVSILTQMLTLCFLGSCN